MPWVIGGVLRKSLAISASMLKLRRTSRRRKVPVALLVNYSEFNSHLAKYLSSEGIRVLWYMLRKFGHGALDGSPTCASSV